MDWEAVSGPRWFSGAYTVATVAGESGPFKLLKNEVAIGGKFPTAKADQTAANRDRQRESAAEAGKPDITVTLKRGIWLVDVHPAYPPRIWRFNGGGLERQGSRVKRAELAYAISTLIARAEEREGR